MMEERGYGRAAGGAAETAARRHTVSIDGRSRISISGVDDVESFDEEQIVVDTCMGILTLKGEDFRISKLNVDSGELIVEGEAESIAYSENRGRDKTGGFFGKLFK